MFVLLDGEWWEAGREEGREGRTDGQTDGLRLGYASGVSLLFDRRLLIANQRLLKSDGFHTHSGAMASLGQLAVFLSQGL